MTRVNLVPVQELMDQHLFAEFRELKMIPKSLARSIRARGVEGVITAIPASFVLGKGHVSFFYDKGCYLFDRYQQIRLELQQRGVNFDKSSELDPDDVFLRHPMFLGVYEPTEQALALIRARIAERIAQKPDWYRLTQLPWR